MRATSAASGSSLHEGAHAAVGSSAFLIAGRRVFSLRFSTKMAAGEPCGSAPLQLRPGIHQATHGTRFAAASKLQVRTFSGDRRDWQRFWPPTSCLCRPQQAEVKAEVQVR